MQAEEFGVELESYECAVVYKLLIYDVRVLSL